MRNGERLAGKFPKEATAGKQYGPNLKALALALTLLTQGYVSVDRTHQILDLGIPVSTGIMSYIGSAKKHGMSAYTALLEVVNGRSLQTVQAWV